MGLAIPILPLESQVFKFPVIRRYTIYQVQEYRKDKVLLSHYAINVEDTSISSSQNLNYCDFINRIAVNPHSNDHKHSEEDLYITLPLSRVTHIPPKKNDTFLFWDDLI